MTVFDSRVACAGWRAGLAAWGFALVAICAPQSASAREFWKDTASGQAVKSGPVLAPTKEDISAAGGEVIYRTVFPNVGDPNRAYKTAQSAGAQGRGVDKASYDKRVAELNNRRHIWEKRVADAKEDIGKQEEIRYEAEKDEAYAQGQLHVLRVKDKMTDDERAEEQRLEDRLGNAQRAKEDAIRAIRVDEEKLRRFQREVNLAAKELSDFVARNAAEPAAKPKHKTVKKKVPAETSQLPLDLIGEGVSIGIGLGLGGHRHHRDDDRRHRDDDRR